MCMRVYGGVGAIAVVCEFVNTIVCVCVSV